MGTGMGTAPSPARGWRGWVAELTDMKTYRPIVAVAVLGLAAMFADGCRKAGSTDSQATSRPAIAASVDADYVGALAAGNRFCMAWQMGRFDVGKAMLSRRLMRQHPDATLKDIITGSGNPVHAAFEISRGTKLSPTRFEFKVRLLLQFTGSRDDRFEAQDVRMVVDRQTIDAPWCIDEFPFPSSTVNLDPKGPAN